MKLAYFVHDLLDPAVTRRVRMLQAGGAAPVVLGFRRGETAPEQIAGAPTVDLGRTFDGRLGHRAIMTAKAALGSGAWRTLLKGSGFTMARTLEMLAVAVAARRTCALGGGLVYESLDIHRSLLGAGPKSGLLRAAERRLMREARLLVVSSPAFLDSYFGPLQGIGETSIDSLLIENKVLELESKPAQTVVRPVGPPWRIGWMGAIRCSRSLDILAGLAARRPDLLEVRIHGRPAYTEFTDFDSTVAAAPGVAFRGPYGADDLPDIYGQVHFSWAVDFMEEGLNSAWLLPNRVYESARHGAVPIALSQVQAGRFLAERGFGVRLDDASDLEGFLEQLTASGYAELREDLDAVPPGAFVADAADCRRMVATLAGMTA